MSPSDLELLERTRRNLEELEDAHARLKFMDKEILYLLGKSRDVELLREAQRDDSPQPMGGQTRVRQLFDKPE